MNMRDMKSRQMGRQSPRAEARARNALAKRRQEEPPPPVGDEDDSLDLDLGEALYDQGDGSYVARSADCRSERDDGERDCPSAPPPGWLDE